VHRLKHLKKWNEKNQIYYLNRLNQENQGSYERDQAARVKRSPGKDH